MISNKNIKLPLCKKASKTLLMHNRGRFLGDILRKDADTPSNKAMTDYLREKSTKQRGILEVFVTVRTTLEARNQKDGIPNQSTKKKVKDLKDLRWDIAKYIQKFTM